MIAEVFGVDGLIILLVTVVTFAIPLWAVIDAIARPAAAFAAAGSSKGMWLALILVSWI